MKGLSRCLVVCVGLVACRGKDPGADGWFDRELAASPHSQFSKDIEQSYGIPLPPRWCRQVAAMAVEVFRDVWTFQAPLPDSPLSCELPLDMPGAPEVLVSFSPYFVFERGLDELGSAASFLIDGRRALYPDAVSVSVVIRRRMALTVSMAEIASAESNALSDAELQALALRLAKALLPLLAESGRSPAVPAGGIEDL